MGISPATFCTWGPGTGATAFGGAAQFSATTDSTITLEDQLPNLFGQNGSYVQFKVYQASASAWTVFGSTTTPDAILINDNVISVTDGTTTASITLDASLSTSSWETIKLSRESDTLYCRVNGVLQSNTATPVAVDIDIISKNQVAYTDVYSIQFRVNENSYLSKATPSATVQGADTGFWRFVAFELTEVGNQCIVDHLSGNDGYRIEVENVYLSTHKLKWTVGDGTTTTTKTSDEVFYVGDTVFAYLDLEDLGETTPDEGDTTFEGTYSPNSGTFYVGAQSGTSNFCGMYLHTLLGDDGNLSTTESDWLINSGLGRAIDEIGASTTVSTSEVGFGYKFNETSGTRADAFGSDDLTENLGNMISATVNNGGFETLDGVDGVFASWTESYVSGSTTSVNAEASSVHAGTYSLRLDVSASNGQTRMTPEISVVSGKSYTMSIYAGIDSLTNSPTFRITGLTANIGFNDYTFSDTAYTEYTDTFSCTTSGQIYLRAYQNCESKSVYFDNFTLAVTAISRAFGLRTSFLTAANCELYLRDIDIYSPAFHSSYSLHTDATDSLSDANDGTASNITWATTDPAAA